MVLGASGGIGAATGRRLAAAVRTLARTGRSVLVITVLAANLVIDCSRVG